MGLVSLHICNRLEISPSFLVSPAKHLHNDPVVNHLCLSCAYDVSQYIVVM
jgi:hypothetical protein